MASAPPRDGTSAARARKATTVRMDDGLVHRDLALDGIRLHAVEAGSGPLVVLLHGFPEFWYSWRYQIPALVEAGYRVIAPDLRGYGLSDKPSGIDAYALPTLAGDIAALIRASGEERAVVVGHDWGGIVAWQLAMTCPERVARLIILNAPHPAKALQGLRRPRQLLKSAYAFFFQLPWLPERVLRAGDFALIRKVFKTQPVNPRALSEADIARYVEAIARPKALTSALNYYRAFFRHPSRVMQDLTPIERPVLVIWGQRDVALEPALAEPEARWVRDLRLVRIEEASHWVNQDAPERVNQLILDFLG